MLTTLKQLIPERVKGPAVAALRPRSHPDLDPWSGRKKVVITLAGFYQNLGDMALTYAQKRFIEEVLPGYEVLLFPSTHTYSRMKALKRVVGPDDIITTIGGGNMDDLYPSLENARRFVIRSFPNNPIVSFPQTMAFTETRAGQRALRRSARTYRRHPRLAIFAREPQSFEAMNADLPGVQKGHVPDTVLSVPTIVTAKKRSGVMVSLRSDKEGVLSIEDRSRVLLILNSHDSNLLMRDTVDVALEDSQPETFESTLREFWETVSSRRLVVTDRLHAMIFCVITRTPAVVLTNSNHKIRETHEAWLKDHSYIRYLERFDEATFSQAVDELLHLTEADITGPNLSSEFGPLREALLAAAK